MNQVLNNQVKQSSMPYSHAGSCTVHITCVHILMYHSLIPQAHPEEKPKAMPCIYGIVASGLLSNLETNALANALISEHSIADPAASHWYSRLHSVDCECML